MRTSVKRPEIVRHNAGEELHDLTG